MQGTVLVAGAMSQEGTSITAPSEKLIAGKDGSTMAVYEFGDGPVDIIWAHGWGQSHLSFKGVTAGLVGLGRNLMLDFPGFGKAHMPGAAWGTIDYAKLVLEWLDQRPKRGPRIWVGHSFGCRIGIRVGELRPGALDGLFLIAAAGIRPPRSLLRRLYNLPSSTTYKVLRSLVRSEERKERLRERFGSVDYRNAGRLRPTFVRVVNEDLTEAASNILVPTRLVYGELDIETPLSVAELFQRALPNTTLTVLPGLGHIDILGSGRFQIQSLLRQFIQEIRK